MPRLKTISSEEDLRQLFKRGRKLENEWFKLWFRNNNLSFGRFVFSIPTSVDKRATVRNRIRRKAREWVRKNLQDKLKADILVYFKKDVLNLTNTQFYEELDRIFRKIYQ